MRSTKLNLHIQVWKLNTPRKWQKQYAVHTTYSHSNWGYYAQYGWDKQQLFSMCAIWTYFTNLWFWWAWFSIQL